MGFFAGLNDEKYDRQYTDRQLVRRMLEYFKPQITRLVWVLVLVVLFSRDRGSLTCSCSTHGRPIESTTHSDSDQPGKSGRTPDRYRPLGIELGTPQSGDTGGRRCGA